jgi:hypothetical protein
MTGLHLGDGILGEYFYWYSNHNSMDNRPNTTGQSQVQFRLQSRVDHFHSNAIFCWGYALYSNVTPHHGDNREEEVITLCAVHSFPRSS